jgi:hypothetical protein
MVRTTTAIALCLVLGVSAADEGQDTANPDQETTPAETKKWTDHNTSDPGRMGISISEPSESSTGMMDALQEVVVLCATQPESESLKREWSSFLRNHYTPDMNINALIDDVVTRAESFRQQYGQTKSNSSESDIDWSRSRTMLLETARASVKGLRF